MKEPTFALCWVAESWNPGVTIFRLSSESSGSCSRTCNSYIVQKRKRRSHLFNSFFLTLKRAIQHRQNIYLSFIHRLDFRNPYGLFFIFNLVPEPPAVSQRWLRTLYNFSIAGSWLNGTVGLHQGKAELIDRSKAWNVLGNSVKSELWMKVLPTCTGIVAMATLSYLTDQAASNVGKIRFTRMANFFLRPHKNLAQTTNGNSRFILLPRK